MNLEIIKYNMVSCILNEMVSGGFIDKEKAQKTSINAEQFIYK